MVYANPFQLLVAVVLSAQTTDEQVNRITAELFTAIPSAAEMSAKEPADLEYYLRNGGLFRHKSRFLVEASKRIVDVFGGQVPEHFEDLITLPGVGRKSANVIISSAFGQPALAVDTHVFRVSRRLGLADGATVIQVEEQLKKIVPKHEWSASHHRLIAHGRALCHARRPKCSMCFLMENCLYRSELSFGQKEGRGFDAVGKANLEGT